jgi:hypothetical protein
MNLVKKSPGQAEEAYLPRRGFLRGLASLPLIGGGVALIGQPTAAAVPVTDDLLERYLSWLSLEHREVYVEYERRKAEKIVAELVAEGQPYYPNYPAERAEEARRHPAMRWFPKVAGVEEAVTGAPPSSRAAIVLGAVGCDWRAS